MRVTSGWQRCRAAKAEVAAVRRKVRASPSITASGWPVVRFITITVASTVEGAPGITVTSLVMRC